MLGTMKMRAISRRTTAERDSRRIARGLTLIELMVTVAIIGVLIVLVGPSFQRFIDTQRLRSINSALITDMQFARAEAASRNVLVKVKFEKDSSNMTCYVILIGIDSDCSCSRNPGTDVCLNGTQEVRTVQVVRSTSMLVEVPDTNPSNLIAFNPADGRLLVFSEDIYQPPVQPYPIDVSNHSIGGFRNLLEVTGKPSVCSPSSSMSGVPACS